MSEISAFAHAIIGSTQVSPFFKDGKALVGALTGVMAGLDAFIGQHPPLMAS